MASNQDLSRGLTKFHAATPALPPLPATAPLTGPVELSGQESVEAYPGVDDATDAATNDSDINQYAVDTSDERDNYEMHWRKSYDFGTAHVDQPDGASDNASDESQSLEIITGLGDSRLTQNDCVDQPGAHVTKPGAHVIQPDEASTIIIDQGDSQQLQNARAEYLRTRDIPCGSGHFEWKGTLHQQDRVGERRTDSSDVEQLRPPFHSWLDKKHARDAQGHNFTEKLTPRCVIVCADNAGAITVSHFVQFVCNKTSVYPRLLSGKTDKTNVANSTGHCDVLIATSGSLARLAREERVRFDRLKTLVLDEFHKIMMSKYQKDQLDEAFFSSEKHHLDVMGSQVQRIIPEGGKSIAPADRDKWLRKDASGTCCSSNT
ncbi:hypothetical protein LTS15_001074 [Exophiala xenobiotica]|nr:hypothetical protein LTS15_001074 [Exophiala xenobiotica]